MQMTQEPSILTESLENLQNVDSNVIHKYLEDLVPDILNFAVQIVLAVLLYLVQIFTKITGTKKRRY